MAQLQDGEIAFEILKGAVRRKVGKSLRVSIREFSKECKLEPIDMKGVLHRILYEIVEENFTQEVK